MSAVGFGGSDTEAKVCAPANIAAPSMAKAVCFIVLLWWYSFSCQLACANRLDPSSATEPTGRVPCNQDAIVGFAAAHVRRPVCHALSSISSSPDSERSR
jgi:hypothetical protein